MSAIKKAIEWMKKRSSSSAKLAKEMEAELEAVRKVMPWLDEAQEDVARLASALAELDGAK